MSILAILFDESNIEEMNGWANSIANSFGQTLTIYYIGACPENTKTDNLLCVTTEEALTVIKKIRFNVDKITFIGSSASKER